MKQIISPTVLRKYTESGILTDKINALLIEQKENWQLLAENYGKLSSVKIKEFEFDGFIIRVQFNPERIKSTAAKVDSASLKNRKSFLAVKNLPPEQKGILYRENYLILSNPYPVFPVHFTVPVIEQEPQLIKKHFPVMLDLAVETGSEFLVLYNGAKCGASAPDHFHFQLGTRDFIPLLSDYKNILKIAGTLLKHENNYYKYAVNDGMRKFFLMASTDKTDILNGFERLYKNYQRISGTNEEPMLNMLLYYVEDKFLLFIFPRSKHRPDCFYREGDTKLLVSPASVDMAGVIILPREEDFNRINENLIENIYDEVSLSGEDFEILSKEMSK